MRDNESSHLAVQLNCPTQEDIVEELRIRLYEQGGFGVTVVEQFLTVRWGRGKQVLYNKQELMVGSSLMWMTLFPYHDSIWDGK